MMHERAVVDRWVYGDTYDHEIVLRGYDAAGELVARRTFAFVATEALIGEEWTTVEDAERGDSPSWTPDEPLGSEEDYYDPHNGSYECSSCEAGSVRALGGPEPPDPDYYGNRRYTYACPDCAERYTVTHAPHGGVLLPEGLRETSEE